jgi:hypothetical protein
VYDTKDQCVWVRAHDEIIDEVKNYILLPKEGSVISMRKLGKKLRALAQQLEVRNASATKGTA